MQVLLLRTLFFIAGCPCVILHEGISTHTKETVDIPPKNPYEPKASAKRQATGTTAFDIKPTSETGSKFTSHLWLVSDSRRKRYGYSHLVSNRTRSVPQGGTDQQKRPHKRGEMNGEMTAAMGTAGGHNNSTRGEHKRNHRRKRGTKEHHKKAFRRRGPKKSPYTLTPPQTYYNALASSLTLWEPMPKPLALTATDFPFDLTRYLEFHTKQVDDPWDATPMTPPYAEDEESELFPNPFYPVTSETYGAYAITIVSALIFAVGITGNIAIMCVVCHNYYMRSISNALLANLAIWDFALLLFCLPLVVFHELTKTWLLGQFTCKVVPYIEVASLGVTTFTLCALCIDRFRAATNVQMYYEMIENCTSTTAKLTVIWLGALLLALPELLIRQLVREEREPPEVTPCEHCVVRISTSLPDTLYVLGLTYNSARLWWYFGCYFCLPTVFTIISSVASARKIAKAERTSVRGNRKQIQLESQMNCTVVALAILYGFCVIPENISNIVSVYMATSVPRRTLDILHLVSQVMLFCKSAVTPVLLLVLCRPFRKAFLDCCCCCLDECGPARSSDATSEDNEQDGTTELELSPYSTVRREPSGFLTVGTNC